MSINLYYVQNINRLDTLYFSSLTEQNTFFNNNLVKSIDTKFPPHFRNTIMLEIDDLDLTTQVNYISLIFNNKSYYYFIDAINYINEGVYELTITMDTIQTYMFNLSFRSALVNRMSISRWTKYSDYQYNINRDYLRENLSTGDLINTSYTVKDDYKEFYVITTREEICETYGNVFPSTVADLIYYSLNDDKKLRLNNGLYYYLIPVFNWNNYNDYYIYVNDVGYGQTTYETFKILMSQLVQNPHVLDIRYIKIPDDTLANVGYFISDDPDLTDSARISFTFNAGAYPDNSIGIRGYVINEEPRNVVPMIQIQALQFATLNVKENLSIIDNFEPNLLGGSTPFNVRFIPQLIDENYMMVEYGERLGYTSYPLHRLNHPYVVSNTFIDIIGGNRIHRLYGDYQYGSGSITNTTDNYFTTIINATDEQVDMYNDQWQNYMSTNRGTLTTGIKLSKQNNLYNFIKGTATNVNDTMYEMGMAGQNPKVNTTPIAMHAMGKQLFISTDALMENYNINKRLQITRENYEYAPDTTKQGNLISADVVANSLDIILRISVVEDIEQVAKKLEYYGYKVSKYYNNKNLFQELNIRRYYNIIQCSDITIELTNTVNTQDIIQNIKDRFINGLRLWNTSIDYSKFDLDNVEKELILYE